MGITIWKPDVCFCELSIQEDGETITLDTVCEVHQEMSQQDAITDIFSLCAAKTEQLLNMPPQE